MKLIHYACLITALLKPTISHVTVSLKNLIKILWVCICAVLCIQNWSQSSYAWQNVCQICLSICFHNWVIFSHICYSKAWSYSCISKEFIRERERKREREREREGERERGDMYAWLLQFFIGFLYITLSFLARWSRDASYRKRWKWLPSKNKWQYKVSSKRCLY